MKKAVVLMLFAVAVYFILDAYYKEGNSGLPNPSVLTAPTYLYGALALSADFLEGFPIVLAAALTMALIWQTQDKQKSTSKSTQRKAS